MPDDRPEGEDPQRELLRLRERVRELERSEATLRSMLESAPDLILVIDADANVLFVNRASPNASVEEIRGTNTFEWLTEESGKRAHEAFAHTLQTGEPSYYEARTRPDEEGSYLRFAVSVGPLYDEDGRIRRLVTVATDVTQERERQEWLRLLFDQAPAVIWSVDTELRLTAGGGQGLSDLGASPGERLGTLFDYFRTSDERHPAIAAHRRALDGESVHYRVDWMGRRYDSYVSPVHDADGHIVGAVGLALDVTEEMHLEDQLRQAQKMDALGQLAGGVAHDFNNLLTAIQGNADVAARRVADESLATLLGEIRMASERASSLTEQLLAFSRRQTLRPRALDPREVVHDTERMLDRLLGEDIHLVLEVEDEVGAVRADPAALLQVLVNLAVNARDAMPEGGTLTLRAGQAPMQQAPSVPGTVVIEVADTGVGMDARTQAKIFEPFFTTKPHGTGLGLSTAYGIIAQSGGLLDVQSEPGEGSRFRVLLPGIDAAPEGADDPAGEVELPGGSETILVAEDDGLVRQLATRILDQVGYQVLAAEDAHAAVQLCRQHDVDLVLTDVVMPDGRGPDLARRITGMQPGVRVLYISGYPGPDDDSAPTPLLPKPFSPESLTRRVREVLDGREATPSGR